MIRTTPERPVDIDEVVPELSAHRGVGTRLHARPGVPRPEQSSVGGQFLWPTDEPWPLCTEPHKRRFGERLADVRLRRRILEEVWSRRPAPGEPEGLTEEEFETLRSLRRGRHAPPWLAGTDPIPCCRWPGSTPVRFPACPCPATRTRSNSSGARSTHAGRIGPSPSAYVGGRPPTSPRCPPNNRSRKPWDTPSTSPTRACSTPSRSPSTSGRICRPTRFVHGSTSGRNGRTRSAVGSASPCLPAGRSADSRPGRPPGGGGHRGEHPRIVVGRGGRPLVFVCPTDWAHPHRTVLR